MSEQGAGQPHPKKCRDMTRGLLGKLSMRRISCGAGQGADTGRQLATVLAAAVTPHLCIPFATACKLSTRVPSTLNVMHLFVGGPRRGQQGDAGEVVVEGKLQDNDVGILHETHGRVIDGSA